ncbi:MAG: hypothetical protein DHS20C02_03530 [Micavibrio sp.]|nr:MAG: hypothetical protein DHS20C02_03530 [Micavibrio sp.]
MTGHKTDILIYGAGIAGLWLFHALKRAGYDVLLLEKNAIGGGQSIASQGIIHSGLKYTLAGQVSELAKSISAMPDVWRAALNGTGAVDLSPAKQNISSQHLLIPPGLMGGLIKTISKKVLGTGAEEVPLEKWPREFSLSGFEGSLIHMDEPVLDVPAVIRALAEPYKNSIRQSDGTEIESKLTIYTAAAGNYEIAQTNSHDSELETQTRPLLMGLIKPAPFPLYAHFVGTSDKPAATVTTHKDKDGTLVWYVGGAVAERAKEAIANELYKDIQKSFAKYMPTVDLSNIEWSSLPIDRIEGKSKTGDWLPDTPTIHEIDNTFYCWPTKLTFAPMLSDALVHRIKKFGVEPSNAQTDWSFLPEVDYAEAPWNNAQWTKEN